MAQKLKKLTELSMQNSGFLIYVEGIINLLFHIFHDCTFKIQKQWQFLECCDEVFRGNSSSLEAINYCCKELRFRCGKVPESTFKVILADL